MTVDLIDLTRAKHNINGVSGFDTLLGVLITAASAAIVRFCNREFSVTTKTELYDGQGEPLLFLRRHPIQGVTWVRSNPENVLEVINTSSSNQSAYVTVLSTGLRLTRTASGSETNVTSGLTWADCPTLTALATAINGLGNGWSASVLSSRALWPASELYVGPELGDGLAMASQRADGLWAKLSLFATDITDYQVRARGWLSRNCPWPCGKQNIAVRYTAGYTTIPEDVQEACAELVALWYWQTKHDPQLINTFTASTTSSGSSYAIADNLPKGVQGLLKNYVVKRI